MSTPGHIPSERPAVGTRPVRPGESEASSHEAWLHDLRNEVNTALMSAAVARRLLADGRHAEALISLEQTEAACYRCARTLHDRGDAH